MFVGYKKTMAVKLVRTRHEVGVRIGMRALDVIENLNKVPREAKVIDVSELDTDGCAVLEFEEETED